jgi:hypothetical protein
MSQHQQAQYIHYTGPPQPANVTPQPSSSSTVAPRDTVVQQHGAGGPVIASGDWTKDLVQLAKTAELKYEPISVLGLPLWLIVARQEACSDPSAPYRAYPLCARYFRPKEEAYSGRERTKEQVRSLVS